MMTESITVVSVFEELRFVWELFAAELILLFPFAKARREVVKRILICTAGMGALSQLYFVVLYFSEMVPDLLQEWVVVSWYMILVFLLLLASRYCFYLTFIDAVYIVTAGYSIQHVVYVIVHEVMAKGLFPQMDSTMPEQYRYLWVYVLISTLVSALWYFIVYLMFNKNLSLCGGTISDDTWKGMLRQIFALVVLMVSTFTCQHIFEASEEMRYFAALLDIMLCCLILANQYSLCRVSLETKEKAALAQMQTDSARFYTISKELIDTVNKKSHDMKHILNALEHADSSERARFIRETRSEIEEYQQVVKTDYEGLNTILAEKSMYCQNRGIGLNCVVGEIPEEVISALDLYVLLGNAIDNAIEEVQKFADHEKRQIDVLIHVRQQFLVISITNPLTTAPAFQDGLPRTTKGNNGYHGFGMKSMRMVVEQYGGELIVSFADNIFKVQIVLPHD